MDFRFKNLCASDLFELGSEGPYFYLLRMVRFSSEIVPFSWDFSFKDILTINSIDFIILTSNFERMH